MRKLFLVATAFAFPYFVLAQDMQDSDEIITLEEQVKFRKNEIGLLGQVSVGYDMYPGGVLLGVNYKRRVKQNFSYRVLGGITPFHEYNTRIINVQNDTITRTSTQANANLAFAGVGLEVQRKFYKRVYLYAALELSGGYGSGDYYNYSYKTKFDNTFIENEFRFTGGSIEKYSIAYMNFSPNIGAKIVFNRVNFGLEGSGIIMSNRISKTASQSNWSLFSDFSTLSTTIIRTFINFSF